MSEDLNISISKNKILDAYLADYPDKISELSTIWQNEITSASLNSANISEDTDPTYPSSDFEQLLITPNDYYENLTSRNIK